MTDTRTNEAAERLSWPTFSNIIREVDGNHDLGAGELAERLLAHPKVREALAAERQAGRQEAVREIRKAMNRGHRGHFIQNPDVCPTCEPLLAILAETKGQP